MDPENSIVKLCVQGMEHESKGDVDTASKLFLSAWEQSTDDFERCIAAHYVARHQSPEESLVWNKQSLDLARAVNDDRVRGFLPSLYLNMGKAYEDLAELVEARQFYAMTEEVLSSLPDNEYGRNLRDAAQRALKRVWP